MVQTPHVKPDRSLNKIPRKRPTFNALLEHPWLLPLSPSRPDFAEVQSKHKALIGEWVVDTVARKKTGSETEEKAKPPLHAGNQNVA